MTRIALATHQVSPSLTCTISTMLSCVQQAAARQASLVVFSETALTGFVHQGLDPEADRALAVDLHSPTIEVLRRAARRHGIHVAFGFFERTGPHLHDSAVLLDPQGATVLHYRRMSPSWRPHQADHEVYTDGEQVPVWSGPFGRVAFLLCGDVFHDEVVRHAREARPDLLLVPFARHVDEDLSDLLHWPQEREIYAQQLRAIGAPGLLVNHLDDRDGCFGGSFAVGADGQVTATQPLHTEGLLVIDLP